MTRAALEDGFHEYVDDIIQKAYDAFDVTTAVRGSTSQSGRLVSTLLKKNYLLDQYVVQPELQSYKDDVLDQIQPLMDYAENPGSDFADYEEELLSHDTYFQELRADVSDEKRQEIRDHLLERQRRLAEAATPIIESEETEFWPAVTATLSREEAEDLVETHFAFTEPLREYPDAFKFDADINPAELLAGPLAFGAPSLTVDFTDEVRRVLIQAEGETIDRVLSEVAQRYD